MSYCYIITPFLAWLVAGSSKFLINSIKSKRLAFDLIGYGGMPSNHSCIVSSTVALIGLKEGIEHPAFLVAMTLAYIVVLDANGLRKHVGLHASRINELEQNKLDKPLRESIGHSKFEIIIGVILGLFTGWFVYYFSSYL